MKKIYKGLLVAIGTVGLWLGASTMVSAQAPVLLRSGDASGFITTPNGLYFHSDNFLWKTDGTSGGTTVVKNGAGQPVSSFYSVVTGSTFQVVTNGRLYFLGGSSQALVLTYIDAFGTARTVTNSPTGDISTLIVNNNQVYFVVGNQLWRTTGDGTQASLVGTYPTNNFAFYNGQIYFITSKASSDYIESNNNITLWCIPLPATTPVAIKDIPQDSQTGSHQLQVAGGTLYILGKIPFAPFTASVYKSNGTAEGTIPVLNPSNLGGEGYEFQPTVISDQLYLSSYVSKVGIVGGPYRVNPATNSIESGAPLYGPLPAGVKASSLPTVVLYKGLYYFSAGNAAFGGELWRSDGTLVKDIQSGPGTSDPQNFYVFNDLLYFNADGPLGRELYRTDGTEAGTQLIADLTPGTGGSLPSNLISFNNELYFTTNTGEYTAVPNLWKLPNSTTPTPPTTTGLALTTPTYDCTTGQLSLLTTGGNGQPIEYRIAGLRDWSASNTFTVPAYQRNGTSFTLEARQGGVVASMPFSTACQSTTPTPPVDPNPPVTPPTGNGLNLAAPTYDCTSGQLALSTTGGNGSLVEYRIAGLRDWAAGNAFTIPAYQRTGTSFTLEARQSGVVVSLPFTASCQTTPPPTNPPVTPPTTTALTVSAQTLNCQTGALQLITTGGDGTPIEYKVPGLGNYSASATFTVPTYQRTGTTFTLYARQSGQEVTGTYTATCPVGARVASPETTNVLGVVVYPNPVSEQFSVGVSGASGQLVRFHLTNLQGQTVVEQRAQVERDQHTESIQLPASGAGLYLLQVSTPTQTKTVKVLKP